MRETSTKPEPNPYKRHAWQLLMRWDKDDKLASRMGDALGMAEDLEIAFRTVEREALERAAKKLDDRIASLQKCEGNTYLQICECSVMARAIRALSENGDSTS